MIEVIDPKKLLLKVAAILDELEIGYFVTGGFALAMWGHVRATADIDIVVELVEPKVASLARALRKISEAGYIDEDAAKEAIRRKGEFNFIDPDTGLKVDFWVMKEDFVVSREYKRRVNRVIDGRGVYFISPEDLILNKLKWHQYGDSALQLDDVKSILKASGGGLDYEYLKTWAKKLEVLDVLESLGNF